MNETLAANPVLAADTLLFKLMYVSLLSPLVSEEYGVRNILAIPRF